LRQYVILLNRTKDGHFTEEGIYVSFNRDLSNLYMANCCSGCNWQFKQPVTMALPTVILKADYLWCWAASFLIRRVAR
jgi:hypothetical protein